MNFLTIDKGWKDMDIHVEMGMKQKGMCYVFGKIMDEKEKSRQLINAPPWIQGGWIMILYSGLGMSLVKLASYLTSKPAKLSSVILLVVIMSNKVDTETICHLWC